MVHIFFIHIHIRVIMSDLIHTFQSHLSGVMETVFKAAIFEITRLVEESFIKEMSCSREQVETLKKRLQWSESRWRNQETRATMCERCGKGHKSNEDGEKTSPPSENDGGLKQENVPERSRGSCELETDTLLGKERSEGQTSFNNRAESADTEDRKLDCILKEEAVYISTDNKEIQVGWTLNTEAETSDFSAHNYSEQELQQIQEDWSAGLSPTTDSIADVQGLPYRTHYNTDELASYNKLDMGDLNGLGEKTEESLGNVVLIETIPNELNMALESERHHSSSSNKSTRRNRGTLSAQVIPETKDMDRDMHCLLINEKGHLQDLSAFSEVHSGIAGDAGQRGYSLYVGDKAHDGTAGLFKERTLSHSLELNNGHMLEFNDASPKGYSLSHSDDAYTCNQCGKKFTQACNLKVHQRVHQRDGLHLCSHCGKGYSSFSDLRRHRCSQTGDKPYTCTLCGNRFSRLWNLKLHRRIHTQEKPHQCTVCNKSFTRADILKVHQRTHTGERPYCCGICGLSFKRLDHLRSHQRKHNADINNQ